MHEVAKQLDPVVVLEVQAIDEGQLPSFFPFLSRPSKVTTYRLLTR